MIEPPVECVYISVYDPDQIQDLYQSDPHVSEVVNRHADREDMDVKEVLEKGHAVARAPALGLLTAEQAMKAQAAINQQIYADRLGDDESRAAYHAVTNGQVSPVWCEECVEEVNRETEPMPPEKVADDASFRCMTCGHLAEAKKL